MEHSGDLFFGMNEREVREAPREDLDFAMATAREANRDFGPWRLGGRPLPPAGAVGSARRRAENLGAILATATSVAFLTAETYLSAVLVGLTFAECEREIGELDLDDLVHHRGSCGEVGPFQIMPVYLYDATETAIGSHFSLARSWADPLEPKTPQAAREVDPLGDWFSPEFDLTRQAITVVSYLDRWGTPLRRTMNTTEGLRWRLWCWAGIHHRGPNPEMENFPASYLSRYMSGIDLANRALRETIADDRKCGER